MVAPATLRLLEADTTAAVILGASDWKEIGLGLAPSFRRSVRGIQRYLFDHNGLGLDPELVLDLFDDPASAGEQLARLRDTLDELLRERREAGRPVADLLIYYVGHGITDDAGRLTLLVRRSRKGLETETGIKAADLARVLKVSAPQQRRLVVLDCCFSEAAAKDFIGMATLDQAVAASAANDLAEALPGRGGLLFCSSPVGQFSIGKPDAALTLFTGAVIEVLRRGVTWCESSLSFLDIRDEAYNIMLQSFGANAPRPALHAFNQTQGDLTRLPAFPNRAALLVAEAKAKARGDKEERDQFEAEEATRLVKEAAERDAIVKAQKEREHEDQLEAEEAARLAKEATERDAVVNAQIERDHKDQLEAEAANRLTSEAAEPTAIAKSQEEREETDPLTAEEAARLVKDQVDEETAAQAPCDDAVQRFPEAEQTGSKAKADDSAVAKVRRLELIGRGIVIALIVTVISLIIRQQMQPPLPSCPVPSSQLLAAQVPASQDAAAEVTSLVSQGDQANTSGRYETALKFYLQAANLGSAEAQDDIGLDCEVGNGVRQNYAGALQWFRNAAALGNADAQWELGTYYQYGTVVGQDFVLADQWFQKAADQDYSFAEDDLGDLYRDGSGVTQNYSQAAQWYQKAAGEGTPGALYKLGLLYQTGGYGLKKDVTKARYLFTQAAAEGDNDAKNWLAANP